MTEETDGGRVDRPVGRLECYGIEWQSPTLPICQPRDDGYWTPWHVAQAEIDSLRAENERLRNELARLENAVDSCQGGSLCGCSITLPD